MNIFMNLNNNIPIKEKDTIKCPDCGRTTKIEYSWIFPIIYCTICNCKYYLVYKQMTEL